MVMHRPWPDSLIDAIQAGEVSPDDVDAELWREAEKVNDMWADVDLWRKARAEGDQ